MTNWSARSAWSADAPVRGPRACDRASGDLPTCQTLAPDARSDTCGRCNRVACCRCRCRCRSLVTYSNLSQDRRHSTCSIRTGDERRSRDVAGQTSNKGFVPSARRAGRAWRRRWLSCPSMPSSCLSIDRGLCGWMAPVSSDYGSGLVAGKHCLVLNAPCPLDSFVLSGRSVPECVYGESMVAPPTTNDQRLATLARRYGRYGRYVGWDRAASHPIPSS